MLLLTNNVTVDTHTSAGDSQKYCAEPKSPDAEELTSCVWLLYTDCKCSLPGREQVVDGLGVGTGVN